MHSSQLKVPSLIKASHKCAHSGINQKVNKHTNDQSSEYAYTNKLQTYYEKQFFNCTRNGYC